jgi:zinc finger CCHC domain-containing protein 9
MVMGLDSSTAPGADEDDFHSFKRRKVEVDHALKREDKMKKQADVRTAVHSGITKSFGNVPPGGAPMKKVVHF